MTFNPASFVKTAHETWELKLKYDKFLAENPHLAAPFHISGLEDILPPQFPGQVAVHFAKSHHGKSTALRSAIFKANRRVEDTDAAIAVVSLEDTAETTAAKFAMRYGDASKWQDDQVFFIGNSFGMKSKEMGQLNIDHIMDSLEWILKEHPGIKRFAHILFDYVQIVPESDNALSRERRDQATYAARQLFDAAKRFSCPVDFASQALLKGSYTPHQGKMRIPGAGDLKEAGDLYEIPHIAIAYWMPKREGDTPIGEMIEEGNWCFRVESNLIFIRIEKWRDCELVMDKNGKPFDVVGRVFPCWIMPGGEIVYDKKRHEQMAMTSVAEKSKS